MALNIWRRLLPGWGATYGPPGDGPFPAILVLHGSEGGWSGWSHRNAAIFAASGFLAFPFSYSRSGNAWVAGDIADVPIDRTVEALRALRGFEFAAPRVGVYGVSRGGEHALLLAALMARDGLVDPPEAVAAHSPSDVVVAAFKAGRWRDKSDPAHEVWDPAERAWTWRGASEELKPTTPIEIERYGGPLFLSHGEQDQMWSVEATRRLEARLIAAGREPVVRYYAGQDHLPNSPTENAHHEALIAFFAQHLERGAEATRTDPVT